MFTPALAQFIGNTGGGQMGFLVQFALLALTLGIMYFMIIRPLEKRAREHADLISAASAALKAREAQAAAQAAQQPDKEKAFLEAGADITSLMSAVRDQAVELRCEQLKVASNLSFDFDVLTDRLSTIEPLLNKAMESARKSEASVALLTVSNDELKQKLSDAEGDLAFYRPLVTRLEDELKTARIQLQETDRKFTALETDHAKAQGAYNELFQKMASGEISRQRVIEENVALLQKLNEHEFTIQTLMRESANLKSEAVSITSDLERAEREAKAIAEKFTIEQDGNRRASAALNSLQAQFKQLRKDSAAQIEQIEGREANLTELLGIKEKQFYDSEVKRSALESKVDFMTRMNQRLREDLRRHLDHIGNLEASNRKLLDLLARNSIAEEQENEARDPAAPSRAVTKLRAVSDTGGSVSTQPVLPD